MINNVDTVWYILLTSSPNLMKNILLTFPSIDIFDKFLLLVFIIQDKILGIYSTSTDMSWILKKCRMKPTWSGDIHNQETNFEVRSPATIPPTISSR